MFPSHHCLRRIAVWCFLCVVVCKAQSGVGFDLLPPLKLWTLLVTSWVTSLLSLFGSVSIVYMIIRKKQWRDESFYSIMIGICSVDILLSTTIAIQPFMLPKGTQFPLAIGSTATCEAVGFLFVAPVAAAAYQCILCLYFLIKVRWGWTELKSRRLLIPWAHAVPVGIFLAFAVAGLVTKSFNPNIFISICSFAPTQCGNDPSCPRGRHALFLSLIMNITILVFSLLAMVFVWLLYSHVRYQGQRSGRYSVTNTTQNQSNAVLVQAMCYTVSYGCLSLTILATIIYRVVVMERSTFNLFAMYSSPGYFMIRLTLTVLFPLQGFFNWIIFIRPNVILWKKRHPNESYLWACRQVLQGTSPASVPAIARESTTGKSTARSQSMESSLRTTARPTLNNYNDIVWSEQLDEEPFEQASDIFAKPQQAAERHRSWSVRRSQLMLSQTGGLFDKVEDETSVAST